MHEVYGAFEEPGFFGNLPGYGFVQSLPERIPAVVGGTMGSMQSFVGRVPVVGRVSRWQLFGIPLFFIGIAGLAGYLYGRYK